MRGPHELYVIEFGLVLDKILEEEHSSEVCFNGIGLDDMVVDLSQSSMYLLTITETSNSYFNNDYVNNKTNRMLCGVNGNFKLFNDRDDLLNIKGILKNGKKGKQVCDDFEKLKHIKQSSLKDRARSK